MSINTTAYYYSPKIKKGTCPTYCTSLPKENEHAASTTP